MDTQTEKLQSTIADDAEKTQVVINNNVSEDDERTQILQNEAQAEPETYNAPAEAGAKGEGKGRIKTAAGVAAAAAVAGGAGFAAAHFLNGKDAIAAEDDEKLEEEDSFEDDEQPVAQEEVDATAAHAEHTAPQTPAKPVEVAARHTAQPVRHGGHETPETTNENDGTFDIVDVETVTDEDGNVVKVIDAEVNGHRAVFLADEEGNVRHGAIDVNDDGEIDDDELVDFGEGNVTINDLAALDNVGEKPDPNLLYASSEHAMKPQQTEGLTDDDKFDVIGIEEVNDNGTVMLGVTANVGGHEAAFLADSEGNLISGAVDFNDNGQMEAEEVMDFSDSGATVDDLIALDNVDGTIDYVKPIGQDPIFLAGDESQEEVDPAEVKVLGVASDIVMEGELVDVAYAEIDDVPVILVDANQNGMADVLIADANGDEVISENEIFDISGEGIAMPTEADITGGYVEAGLDYNNDADTGYFDV